MSKSPRAALACGAWLRLLPAVIGVAVLAPVYAQELPAGKGRETFKKVCTQCHDNEATVKLRNTRNGWMDVVRSMKDNGAQATEAEFSEIVDYLTLHFGKKEDGSAKKAGPASSAGAASPVPLRPVPWEKNRLQIGRAIYRENCVVCHDVEMDKSQKLGPSFYHLFQRDKMPRSSAKPERTLIAGKVRVGGPLMPPFNKKLTSAEIEALLDYMQSK